MMYFLGQAANYRGKILKHLFACGKKADFDALIKHLATRYQVPIKYLTLPKWSHCSLLWY